MPTKRKPSTPCPKCGKKRENPNHGYCSRHQAQAERESRGRKKLKVEALKQEVERLKRENRRLRDQLSHPSPRE